MKNGGIGEIQTQMGVEILNKQESGNRGLVK